MVLKYAEHGLFIFNSQLCASSLGRGKYGFIIGQCYAIFYFKMLGVAIGIAFATTGGDDDVIVRLEQGVVGDVQITSFNQPCILTRC